ncbi:hypothetical protein [Roseimaritima sediminicola]|uniref:hypothetical protein n=1 Tax=Roseimaritima sediminicola TaxID=2662066 RepID=UPI00129824E5|nr:hypothetical protein [Roseimaritima sediminicola]
MADTPNSEIYEDVDDFADAPNDLASGELASGDLASGDPVAGEEAVDAERHQFVDHFDAEPPLTEGDSPVAEAGAVGEVVSAETAEVDAAESGAAEVDAAESGAEDAAGQLDATGEDATAFDDASEPFVGQWQRLVSSTNWEKGRIIGQWRGALIEAGAHPTEYSDEAWARRAGGVTAPHVGRLRRVYDRFGKEHESYPGLYWSHFLAALDWDDAPMWLEGAVRSGWSVSQLREQRWQATGGDPKAQPQAAEVVDVDLDEDVVMPAQGGGGRGEFDDKEPAGVSAGPDYEGPDFGDEDDISGARGCDPAGAALAEPEPPQDEAPQADLIQPFRNLPELPEDLNDAVESLKLAILRHKATQWEAVKAEDVVRYLVGLRMLVEARAE